MTTLFEKLGGEKAVKIAVEKFYERVLNDNRVNYFFDNVNMVEQKKHQRAFLTYAFGGAPQYDGRTMRIAHEKLVKEQGLEGIYFDAIAGAPQHRSDVLNQ